MDTTTNTFVVIDYGMCKKLSRNESPPQPTMDGDWSEYFASIPRQCCGKRNYFAPEMLNPRIERYHPMLSDIWAMGIILFMVLTGVPPIDMATELDERFVCIAQEQALDQLVQAWGLVLSKEVVDLIQKMLQEDPKDRWTLPQIKTHPWLQSHYSS